MPTSELVINTVYHKYSMATINGKVFGGYTTHSNSSSIVCIKWNLQLFGKDLQIPAENCIHQDTEIRPARINYFAKHALVVNGTVKTHLWVSLSWFKHLPESIRNVCGKPVTLWDHTTFEQSGIHSLIPFQFIHSRTITLVDKLNDDIGCVLFVSPLV